MTIAKKDTRIARACQRLPPTPTPPCREGTADAVGLLLQFFYHYVIYVSQVFKYVHCSYKNNKNLKDLERFERFIAAGD